MVTRSTEEAMAVLRKYRKFLIARGRYEAFLITKKEGSVHCRKVHSSMVSQGLTKPVGIGVPSPHWLGAIFNKCPLFTTLGDHYYPLNDVNDKRNIHNQRPVLIWYLAEGAVCPPKIDWEGTIPNEPTESPPEIRVKTKNNCIWLEFNRKFRSLQFHPNDALDLANQLLKKVKEVRCN